MLSTLNNLSKLLIDFEPKGLRYSTIYKQNFKSCMLVTILILINLLFDILNFLNTYEVAGFIKVFGYLSPFVLNAFNILSFCTYLSVISYCFELLNTEMRKIGNRFSNFASYIPAKVEIMQISQSHFKLVILTQQLNKYYSGPILFSLALNFVAALSQLYYWSEYTQLEHKTWTAKQILYSCTFFILLNGTVLALVVVCNSTTYQVSSWTSIKKLILKS